MKHDEKPYFNFTLTVYGDFNTILNSMVKSIVTMSSFDLRSSSKACRMILHGGSWSAEAKMWILRSDILVGGDWNNGTWLDYIFPYIYIYIGNFIIPTDFHIFQRGRYTTNQYWFYNVFTVHVSVCNWSNWCGIFVRIQGRQPNQPTNRGLFGIRHRMPPSCKLVYKPHELNVVISCYIYYKYP